MAFAAPMSIQAAEGRVELALRPIDQAGHYFDVTLRPGETRTLEVELANVGDTPLAARTYAADVYTIVNGGFGARLRGETQSGTTLWLDYSTDVLQLPAGQGIRRTFTLAVPVDAEPGEYITSLVLENNEPIRGSGDVAIDQIVRQATAVVVTVPGPRSPGLVIGAASHKGVADKSVIAVVIENTGNVRLKPIAELILIDGTDHEVSRAAVPMDTLYAHTETLVEVPLAALLQPGRYNIRLTLADPAQDLKAKEGALSLVVEPPPAEPRASEGVAPTLTEVDQAPPAEPAVGDAVVLALTDVIQGVGEGRVPLSVGLALMAASLALGIAIGAVLLLLRRRTGVGRDRSGREVRR